MRSGRRNIKPGLAKPIDLVLDEVSIEPLPGFFAHRRGVVGLQPEQFPQAPRGRVTFPELAIHCGQNLVCREELREVDVEGEVQRSAVVPLTIGLVVQGKPVPPGVSRVEPQRPLDVGAASLPVAGVRQHAAQAGERGSVERIEFEGALRSDPEGGELLPEEQCPGQGVVCQSA